MSFLKSVFGFKEEPIHSYSDFWKWFEKNEKSFYKVVKEGGNVKKFFFDRLSPKLGELRDGFWFLVGMYDDTIVELVLTADGVIKNIVFVEELVAASPKMDNWKITALKQPLGVEKVRIEMDGYLFDTNTMSFYATEDKEMPDEIDITVAHEDFTEENKGIITNGVYITLDNALGELNSVITIDNLTIINPAEATSELVPLEKLTEFLTWREKEFVEKYKGFRRNTENDSYSGLEATLENGLPLVAMVNTDLLNWDSKASHPWIVILEMKYDGENSNGMPNSKTYELLNQIEDEIMTQLKDSDGYLNIGRQTANSAREVYFACCEFRKPSKLLYNIKAKYRDKIELDFDIYKDKYWQSFDRFIHN
ncbi:MAG: DUF695 domain-containing protein [Bacteroidota bacterium]